MPMLGQASGGFTESSSALRLLHVGIRNTTGILTDDAFTQTNPPIVITTTTISDTIDTGVLGVLSGSVAFSRPDQGSNYIGGNAETLATAAYERLVQPLGCFINNASGNAFENQPAAASGVGPYVSACGTYGNATYETQFLADPGGGAIGDDITYVNGLRLCASRNGYLCAAWDVTNNQTLDLATIMADMEHGWAASTVLAVLKMPADSVQAELVYDQRI